MSSSAPVMTKVSDALHLGGSILHEMPEKKHSKKILLVLSSATAQMPQHRTGFHWHEAWLPFELLAKEGYDCDVVSETGVATPDEMSLGAMAMPGDLPRWEDKQYIFHRKLAQMKTPDMINVNDYAAVFVAGGHAAVIDLPHGKIRALMAQIYENGGVLGVLCHGPAVFDGMKLSNGRSVLEGVTATGFPDQGEEKMGVMEWMREHNYKTMQQVITSNGGRWTQHASNPMADYTEADKRIVTGMNPASCESLVKKMLDYLPATEEYQKNKSTSAVTNPAALPDKTAASTGMGDKSKMDYSQARTTNV